VSGETFGTQSAEWLRSLRARRRKPISPSTLRTFQTHIRRLTPLVGADTLLENIHSGFLKNLVAKMDLSPKTISDTLVSLRSIVASAVDEKTGEPLYPRTWNSKFIDAPQVLNQKRPTVTAEKIEAAIEASTTQEEQLLYAVLGGTGLRISEALSIRIGPVAEDQTAWLPTENMVCVRATMFGKNEQRGRVKTPNAKRDVDLSPNLNAAIQQFTEASQIQQGQFLFRQWMEGSTADHFRPIGRGIPGYHSLRRFRISHLRSVSVLADLTRYWAGHGAESITDIYAKLGEDVGLRREWAIKAGLGFSIDKLGCPAPSLAKNQSAKPLKPRKKFKRASAYSVACATAADQQRRAALTPQP
jgi:integrase